MSDPTDTRTTDDPWPENRARLEATFEGAAMLDKQTTEPAGLRECWNCDGTGKGLVFNVCVGAAGKDFKPGPCVVCSGRGRLAAND